MKTFYFLFLFLLIGITANSQVSFYTNKLDDSSDVPKKYYMEIEYPLVQGLSDAEIQKNINAEIKRYINKSIYDFKLDLNDWKLPDIALRDIASGFYVNYEAVISNDIFSTILYLEHYFTGTAHPNHESYTMNFDLKTGKLIQFSELFDKDKKYLEKISELCINYLKNKNEDMPVDESWIKTGASPDEKNFKSFNIKPECLLITFDPYQVGAYALGSQSVEIKYKEIKDIVDKNGVLKVFYK